MAKQNSLLKIQGTIGGMTFYHTKDGNLVREKFIRSIFVPTFSFFRVHFPVYKSYYVY